MTKPHLLQIVSDDKLDIRVEVSDLAPEDPRITALLALLFPDPRPAVPFACYPHGQAA